MEAVHNAISLCGIFDVGAGATCALTLCIVSVLCPVLFASCGILGFGIGGCVLQVYWTDVAGKAIRRAFLNGSRQEDVVALSRSERHVSLSVSLCLSPTVRDTSLCLCVSLLQ